MYFELVERLNSAEMEGGDRRQQAVLWKNLKRRLGLKGIMGFCGSSSCVIDDRTITGEEPLMAAVDQSPAAVGMSSCIDGIPAGDGAAIINLATALAADRQQETNVGSIDRLKIKPLKTLMRLFEEIDGRDVEEEKGGRIDTMCCICIERNKGAALIPCGHTYCRVCSKDLWMKGIPCPLCNRSITEILDIF